MARENLPLVQPGDIIVTSGDKRSLLSRLVMWATDSAWTHVFLVKDADTLVEAWFPSGVREQPLAARFESLAKNEQTYRVLRSPELSPERCTAVLAAAHTMLGRRYDILQAVLYGLFHVFMDDGPKRVVCSRFITACYQAAGIDLFPAQTLNWTAGKAFSRYNELRKGWVIPQDLLAFSNTDDVTRQCRDHAPTAMLQPAA